VNQNLHFWGDAADWKPGNHSLSGKVLPLEDEPFACPRRNPAAPIIKTHSVRVNLSPLCIMQYEGCWNLSPKPIHDPSILGSELLQAKPSAAGEIPQTDDVIHQHDYVEIFV
jgi:hypothetical protein